MGQDKSCTRSALSSTSRVDTPLLLIGYKFVLILGPNVHTPPLILLLDICVWADVCSFMCVKKEWQWMNCENGWTSPGKCVSAHCAVECKGFSARCQRSFMTCWTDVTNLRHDVKNEFSRRLGKSDTFVFILFFGLLAHLIEMTVEIKVWNYRGRGGPADNAGQNQIYVFHLCISTHQSTTPQIQQKYEIFNFIV